MRRLGPRCSPSEVEQAARALRELGGRRGTLLGLWRGGPAGVSISVPRGRVGPLTYRTAQWYRTMLYSSHGNTSSPGREELLYMGGLHPGPELNPNPQEFGLN